MKNKCEFFDDKEFKYVDTTCDICSEYNKCYKDNMFKPKKDIKESKDEEIEEEYMNAYHEVMQKCANSKEYREDFFEDLQDVMDIKEIFNEPKTFDCGFKALSWLTVNPMREISFEITSDIVKMEYKVWLKNYQFITEKLSKKEDTHCINNKSGKLFTITEVFNWINIKVLPKEKK